MPATIALCSAASRAQWTWAPSRVALASNCSRYSSSRDIVCSLIRDASSRSVSHSGTRCELPDRAWPRADHSAASCQRTRSRSATNCGGGDGVVGWIEASF